MRLFNFFPDLRAAASSISERRECGHSWAEIFGNQEDRATGTVPKGFKKVQEALICFFILPKFLDFLVLLISFFSSGFCSFVFVECLSTCLLIWLSIHVEEALNSNVNVSLRRILLLCC